MLSSGADFATVIAGFQGLGIGTLGTNGTKSKSAPNVPSVTARSSTESSAESSGSYTEVTKALAFMAKPSTSEEALSAKPVLGEKVSDGLGCFDGLGDFDDPGGPKLISVTQCLLNVPHASGDSGSSENSGTVDTDLVAFARANPDSSGPQGYIARTQPLMTNKFTGKPLRCIHCGRWQNKAGSAYWVGECRICHGPKIGNAVCTVMAVDWLGERGYV